MRGPNRTATGGVPKRLEGPNLVSSPVNLKPSPSLLNRALFLPPTTSLVMALDTPLPTNNEKAAIKPSNRTSRRPSPPPAFVSRFFSPSLAAGWRLSSLKTLIRCTLVFAAGHVLIFAEASLNLLGQAAFFCGESPELLLLSSLFPPSLLSTSLPRSINELTPSQPPL